MKKKALLILLTIMMSFITSQNIFVEKLQNIDIDINNTYPNKLNNNIQFSGYFVSSLNNNSNDDSYFDYYHGFTKIASFTQNGFSYYIRRDNEFDSITYSFLNKNNKTIPKGKINSEAKFNFISNLNSGKIGIESFTAIIYEKIWPNIDLIYYGTTKGIKYEFIVHKGGQINNIKLQIDSKFNPRYENDLINKNLNNKIEQKTILIQTSLGLVFDSELYAYGLESKNNYDVSFDITDQNIVSFTIKTPFNETLVIDPLIYSSYINSNSDDSINSIAIDDSGFIYVSGYTQGLTFPTTLNSFDETYNGNDDIFVMKFYPNGSKLVFSTFIGSSSSERVEEIVVDNFGNIVGTGYATGPGLPTTAITFDSSYNGDYDAFVFKLNASGNILDYCSYLGTSDFDFGKSVAVNSKGYIYIFGNTYSNNFPITLNAFDQFYNGGLDAFIVKLNPNNTILEYGTYIGGSLDEDGLFQMKINEIDILFCTGSTKSNNFPTLTNAYDSKFNGGLRDGFFMKFNTTIDELFYSSFFGGSEDDATQGITFDNHGNIYLTGYTYSPNLPVKVNVSYDATYNINKDAFIAKFTNNGTELGWVSYLGGASIDDSFEIAIDSHYNIHVAGYTTSGNFPTYTFINDTITYNGNGDIFISVLSPDGRKLIYSNLLGGTQEDIVNSIEIDVDNLVILGGKTKSDDFSITNDAFESIYESGGLFGWDSFISKIKALDLSIKLETPSNNSDNIEGTLIDIDVSSADTVIYNWDGLLNRTWEEPYQTLIPETPGTHILFVYANDSENHWIKKQFYFNLNPDIDNDGLTNIQEVYFETNPFVNDTDEDGLTDGQEVLTYHTDPLDKDTDKDGFSDYLEVNLGYDPNNPEDHPPYTRLPSITTVAPELDLSIKIFLIIGVVLLAAIVILLVIREVQKQKPK